MQSLLIDFAAVGGQGIASGFRDAISLSWRLAIACQSDRVDVDTSLLAWYRERKQQLEASLASTVRNGNLVNTKSFVKIFIRDWALWLMQLIPPVKRWLELGPRQGGRMQYNYVDGMPFMPHLGGGALFSQSYCVALDRRRSGRTILFTDDVIFDPSKTAMFQLVVLLDGDLGQLESRKTILSDLERVCPRLHPSQASFFVKRQNIPTILQEGKHDAVYRTASAEEFDKSHLCTGRPKTRGYKEFDMWTGVNNKPYVIVRPDRFVFAACESRRELEMAASRLNYLFPT